MSREDGRTEWFAPDLKIKSEPLLLSLVKYRMDEDRWLARETQANLVSSKTESGTHKPILDLDVPIRLEGSHLYIEVPNQTKFQRVVGVRLLHAIWNLLLVRRV